jgi:hypothetical protein
VYSKCQPLQVHVAAVCTMLVLLLLPLPLPDLD